jgi:hypothetical protein
VPRRELYAQDDSADRSKIDSLLSTATTSCKLHHNMAEPRSHHCSARKETTRPSSGVFARSRSKQYSCAGCRIQRRRRHWACRCPRSGTARKRERDSGDEVSEEKNDSGVRAARELEVVASIRQISRTCSTTFFRNILGIWLSLSPLVP